MNADGGGSKGLGLLRRDVKYKARNASDTVHLCY